MRSEQKLGLCRVLCPEPMVFRAQDLMIVQVTPDVSAEDMLQHLTCNRSQGNRAVIGWIWAAPLLKTGAIQVFFHWMGISPVCIDWLKIAVRAGAISISRKRLQDPRRNFHPGLIPCGGWGQLRAFALRMTGWTAVGCQGNQSLGDASEECQGHPVWRRT